MPKSAELLPEAASLEHTTGCYLLFSTQDAAFSVRQAQAKRACENLRAR